MERSIAEALVKPGFSFIEVLAPCPTLYGRMNKMGQGVIELRSYQERCVVQNGADPREADIGLSGPIVVGKFVDIDRPTFWDYYIKVFNKAQKKR
jgi:2-oxoglutarate ferredoxin oxidoreductase subunit beta